MSDRFHEYRFAVPGFRYVAGCRDGRHRSAVVTGFPDSFSTVPAAVQVTAGGRRVTVSGFLFMRGPVLCFSGTGRNAALIPWTGHRPRLATLARRLIGATAWGFGCPGVHWELPSEHAAQLFKGVNDFVCLGVPPAWISKNPPAREVWRRMTHDDCNRLTRFFSKLERFALLTGE
jgi:hypothetical protein